MFIIKLLRKGGGYTSYCAEIYTVEYAPEKRIVLHITPHAVKGEGFQVLIDPETDEQVFIENNEGRTVDRIDLRGPPGQTPPDRE